MIVTYEDAVAQILYDALKEARVCFDDMAKSCTLLGYQGMKAYIAATELREALVGAMRKISREKRWQRRRK